MSNFKYKVHELYNPTLAALHDLGGSASVSEIEDFVIEHMKLSEKEVSYIHRGTATMLNYRLRWARNHLKHFGLLENSSRGVWSLTALGSKSTSVSPNDVLKVAANVSKKNPNVTPLIVEENSMHNSDIFYTDSIDDEISWQEEALNVIKKIHPAAFERLCQRLLRELGFKNVEVTGKPNDGGIDGKGILRLGGILSFHVVFQAKRFKDTVGSEIVRNFRGSLSAKVDKGLIISTGRYTVEAKKEAQRDGAIPIDLIDGEELVEKLKELQLGVNITLVEKVIVDSKWFDSI
ncbi:MAG: restriction endonuclease [Bacteroidetes bacterium]|nr:restriction endonuclease [Bacteroidota bacterium]